MVGIFLFLMVHQVNLHLDTAAILVSVEPHLIQQVVFNIVNNACQAMKDPGILNIETRYEASLSQVVLSVTDTGPGIESVLKDKIFEPFFTTKKEGLGTGLGLSLSKKIVESHKGQIEVTSKLGVGSTFKVFLPRAEDLKNEKNPHC